MAAAEQITDSVTHHGEGAVWSAGWGGLKFVDMLAGDVLSLDGGTGAVTRVHVGSPVAAAVRPRARGGFVVATEREFALFDADGRRQWSGPALWDGDVRFNDGSCDPLGRFLCGSMGYHQQPGAGAMWRLNLDGTADRLFDGVTISNGLGFRGDGKRAYYVDTPTRRIDVFDVQDGELVDRRPFAPVADGAGDPDGLCVDAGDGVWVALYGGSAVHHYGADGRLDEVVRVPARQVTSCTLGGTDLRTLYITTSREGLAPDDEPAAGAVFAAVTTGAPGLPVPTAGM